MRLKLTSIQALKTGKVAQLSVQFEQILIRIGGRNPASALEKWQLFLNTRIR
jgi:hypothetical protein